LTLVEIGQARTFNRRNVDERILAATFRLNETEALRCIEPLHRSSRHRQLLLGLREWRSLNEELGEIVLREFVGCRISSLIARHPPGKPMRYWWVNQNQTYRQEVEGGLPLVAQTQCQSFVQEQSSPRTPLHVAE
jgi:hypothetical protein